MNAAVVLALVLASQASEPAPAPETQATAVLEQAVQLLDELEYDRAAALLTEVIVDEAASLPQKQQARVLLARVEVIRGYNAEARAHYTWLLEQDPTFALGPDEPPKVRGFFELVREDFLRERKRQEELVRAAEKGKQEVRRAAEEEVRKTKEDLQASTPAPRSGASEGGGSVLPPPDEGTSSLLGAGLTAYGCSAASAVAYLGPFFVIALTNPSAAFSLGICCALGCGASAPAAQGLGTVFLGDQLGGGRSRWAYLFTTLASFVSFVGCMGVSAGVLLGVIAIAPALVTGLNLLSSFPNSDLDDLTGLAAVLTAVVLGLLFVVVEPIAPLVVYALYGNDAAGEDEVDDDAPRQRRPARPRREDDDGDDVPSDLSDDENEEAPEDTPPPAPLSAMAY